MRVRADLIRRIEAHLAAKNMSPRAFSLLVSRDHRWLTRFQRGRATLQSIERAELVLDGKITAPLLPRSERSAPHRGDVQTTQPIQSAEVPQRC